MDNILNKWLAINNGGVQTSRTKITTILFADDQLIIADSEDKLHFASHKLNKILRKYGLTISVEKSKVMAFRGREPKKQNSNR
jgi:hypothetical protein